MNGLITRLILTFVGGSTAFTLLPLLESGQGAPLIAVLDRSRSLVVYAAFLVLFALFVLPAFIARDDERDRRWPWAAVVAYILVFAAIPLIFTAYISGVSARGLLPIAALCAATLAIPLALRRCLGPAWGSRVSALLGGVFIFALPGSVLYLESVGRVGPAWVEALSIPHWLHRLATLRYVPPSAWPFVAFAAVPWCLASGSMRRKPRGASVSTAAGVLVFAVALSSGAEDEESVSAQQARDVRVESLAGGVARPGFRTPLAVTLPDDGGTSVVSAGVDGVRVPRDGVPHRVLLIPGEGVRRLRVDDAEFPLPVELISDRLLVLVIGTMAVEAAVSLDPEDVPAERGALEAFDVIVVARGTWDRLTPPVRAALERWMSLGGRLVRETPRPDFDRAVGSGRDVSINRLGGWMPTAARFRASALDGELTRTFAPPTWQQMDLSDLLKFAVIYHAAFLAAFLLPMLLDSRKALTVYLVSVGFVVIVVAGFAWNVLGDIFLRDNQVYTHAITLMVADDGPAPRVASHQFLCFASMSAEDRSVAFEADADLVVYQSPLTPRRVVRRDDGDSVVLEEVHLDRFRHKLVVRVDRESPLPIRLEGDPASDAGIRLVDREGVPDPLGLRDARPTAAWYVQEGRVVRRLEPHGGRLVAADPAVPTGLPGEVQVHVRKLLGHFAPGRRNWLLVRWADLPRADEARDWLWSRDLGGWLLLPL